MINNKSSKKYITIFSVFLILIILITISNKFFYTNDKYNTVYAGEILKVGNSNLLVKNIIKTDKKFILELIDNDYIENSEGYIYEVKSKKSIENEIKIKIKAKYKGYIRLEMNLKNGYEHLKFGIAKNEKKSDLDYTTIYFNEFEIPVDSNYKEKTEKENILDYLNYMIEYQKNQILEENKKIEEYNLEITKKEKENKELKKDLEFQLESEKIKTTSKIDDNNSNIKSINENIFKSKNEIIQLKNKIIILESEIHFIKTGEKKEIKLLEIENKNIENYKEKNIITTEKKEEKEQEQPQKTEENKDNNNININNNQKNNTKTEKNNTNYIPNPQPQPQKTEEKPQEQLNPQPKKEPKKIIEPIKKDKEKGEIEIEFTP